MQQCGNYQHTFLYAEKNIWKNENTKQENNCSSVSDVNVVDFLSFCFNSQ